LQPILYVERDKKLNTISSADSEGLLIEVQSTGQKISVTRTESIIDALARSGIEIPTSCQSGLCGTCKTRYISGDVEHGDCILSDVEHQEYLTPCISHIKTGTLVLDL
jgi:vanillate O-demethylase ferredoxin subunit